MTLVWMCAAVARRGGVSVWLLLRHVPVGARGLSLSPINPTGLLGEPYVSEEPVPGQGAAPHLLLPLNL